MIYYRFVYNSVDGKFGIAHDYNILEENGEKVWESVVHIPDIKDFVTKQKHTISYITPFGMVYKEF